MNQSPIITSRTSRAVPISFACKDFVACVSVFETSAARVACYSGRWQRRNTGAYELLLQAFAECLRRLESRHRTASRLPPSSDKLQSSSDLTATVYMAVHDFRADSLTKCAQADDRAIKAEGLDNLTEGELREACRARGIRGNVYGEGARAFMIRQLSEWLELSLNRCAGDRVLLRARVGPACGWAVNTCVWRL